MADNKENNKITVFNSFKCKSKTQLKEINNIFSNMHSGNKRACKLSQNSCTKRSLQFHNQSAVTELYGKTSLDNSKLESDVSTKRNIFSNMLSENNRSCKNGKNSCNMRSFYHLRSHNQSAVTEKVAFDNTKLESNVCTKENVKLSNISTSIVNKNYKRYRLQATQKKRPEGKESRQNDSDNTVLSDSSASSITDCETHIANDVISSFSSMSLSGVAEYKNMHSESILSSPSANNEPVMQCLSGVGENGNIGSCNFENSNYNSDGIFKRKVQNEIDKMSKKVKKKKETIQLLEKSEFTENDFYSVKRKTRGNHDKCNINKRNKCESDVHSTQPSVCFESNLQTNSKEEFASEHINIELEEKNMISSTDFITVINKILYNSHDRPNLKFYPDIFVKCTSQPSACIDIHTNDGTAEMEESTAFILKSLMKSNMWTPAFNNFYTFLTSENYLPTSLLRLLFNFIITASDTVLMYKAVEIITCHWDMHPPCRENMKKHYMSLLTESEVTDKDLPLEVSNDGLLYCILNMLENVLENPNQNRNKLVRTTDFHGLLMQPVKHEVKPVSYQEMSDQWQNFDSLEVNKEHCQNKMTCEAPEKDNQYLTHSEQIERLFLALELVLEVMERDMGVWLVKYSFTPFKYIHQSSFCPLIGKVFRSITKQVLKLYHLSEEHKHSRILSRFISLLAEVARISEIQDIEGKGLIQYPYFSTECNLFVEDVYRSFVQSVRTTDEKLELLDLLQPAWVRMFVASQWLSDNLGYNYGHDLECAIKILQSNVGESEVCRNFSVEAYVHEEEASRGNAENGICKETSVSSRLRKKAKTTTNKRSQNYTAKKENELTEEIIHILIIMTSSYIKTYCLQEIYNILKCKHLFENVVKNYSDQDRKGRVKLRFNYVQIVNDLHKYRELGKLLKSLSENIVFYRWLSVLYPNS